MLNSGVESVTNISMIRIFMEDKSLFVALVAREVLVYIAILHNVLIDDQQVELESGQEGE